VIASAAGIVTHSGLAMSKSRGLAGKRLMLRRDQPFQALLGSHKAATLMSTFRRTSSGTAAACAGRPVQDRSRAKARANAPSKNARASADLGWSAHDPDRCSGGHIRCRAARVALLDHWNCFGRTRAASITIVGGCHRQQQALLAILLAARRRATAKVPRRSADAAIQGRRPARATIQ
jgi:hypothetical protein